MKMKMKVASAAFSNWSSVVAENRRNRTILARAGAKIKLRAVAMTLSAWVDYTATRKHNRKLVWGILSRLCNGELYAGFNQWNSAIKEMKELEGKLRKAMLK